jgi:hypothetical protein
MPATARAPLVFEHDARSPRGLEERDDVAGHVRVAIAVIDVHQQVVLRQHRADALHEGDHVRPGDETDVGQAVEAGGETEAADKQRIKMFSGDAGGEHIIDSDERRDCPLPHGLAHPLAR